MIYRERKTMVSGGKRKKIYKVEFIFIKLKINNLNSCNHKSKRKKNKGIQKNVSRVTVH